MLGVQPPVLKFSDDEPRTQTPEKASSRMILVERHLIHIDWPQGLAVIETLAQPLSWAMRKPSLRKTQRETPTFHIGGDTRI